MDMKGKNELLSSLVTDRWKGGTETERFRRESFDGRTDGRTDRRTLPNVLSPLLRGR